MTAADSLSLTRRRLREAVELYELFGRKAEFAAAVAELKGLLHQIWETKHERSALLIDGWYVEVVAMEPSMTIMRWGEQASCKVLLKNGFLYVSNFLPDSPFAGLDIDADAPVRRIKKSTIGSVKILSEWAYTALYVLNNPSDSQGILFDDEMRRKLDSGDYYDA